MTNCYILSTKFYYLSSYFRVYYALYLGYNGSALYLGVGFIKDWMKSFVCFTSKRIILLILYPVIQYFLLIKSVLVGVILFLLEMIFTKMHSYLLLVLKLDFQIYLSLFFLFIFLSVDLKYFSIFM